MGKGAPVFEFLSSPFGLVAVGLGVLAVAVLALCLWITTLDRRMRGMADGLETERRKVAELQMVIGRRANAARSYGNRGRAAAPAPAPAPAPASAVQQPIVVPDRKMSRKARREAERAFAARAAAELEARQARRAQEAAAAQRSFGSTPARAAAASAHPAAVGRPAAGVPAQAQGFAPVQPAYGAPSGARARHAR